MTDARGAVCRLILALAMTGSTWGCDSAPRTESRAADGDERLRGDSIAVPARPAATAVDSLPLDDAIARLATLEGEFRPAATGVGFDFTGDRALFRRIRHFQHEAVARLVSCMADTTSARATVDGRPVPTGVMCYHALDAFVYHETTDSSGDSGGSWAGQIAARATFAELRAAQEAWSRLLEPPGYVMIPPAMQ